MSMGDRVLTNLLIIAALIALAWYLHRHGFALSDPAAGKILPSTRVVAHTQ